MAKLCFRSGKSMREVTIAIIEMNKDDPNTPHKNQPELLLGRDEILQWMSDAGFRLMQEHADLFPGTEWFLVFARK
jgi:hypothetical protein